MGTTARRRWEELPAGLRREVARRLGGEVRGFGDRPGGFSYGVLGVAEIGDGGGRVFVKAVPGEDGDGYREEAVVARALPVAGVPTVAGRMAGRCETWRALAEGGVHAPLTAAGLGAWERGSLDRLAGVEGRWAGLVTGDTLLHFDLRHDNVLVAPGGTARFVDWGRACLGPGWVDLMCLLLLSRADGVDLEETFLAHPLGRGAPPDAVDAFLVALAGYWTHTAALPGPAHAPHLQGRRERSRAATIGWLRRRWGRPGRAT
ncbi:phosphotransferase [Nonomuraea sp. NPDC050691]|uniref:phosphotransferase family protein n=1 Tax=Nonomuraea sp. NPDC050691 TaxID=3155661 RepID=UPI0033C53282